VKSQLRVRIEWRRPFARPS